MANSVDPDQTAPIGVVCSGSTLFASILNSSIMLGKYFQQTTFSDAFFLSALRVNFMCRSREGMGTRSGPNRLSSKNVVFDLFIWVTMRSHS